MPNGVSCAYFAARNFIYGSKEDNLFKEGIGAVQTARTFDAIANVSGSVLANAPKVTQLKKALSKIAACGRKIVYPLIIASGIYNTAKSKDKVKTGITQGIGIGTMYAFETAAEKGLNAINCRLRQSEAFKNNKYLRMLWYIAKGTGFVIASLTGYNTGSKMGEKATDIVRKHITKSAEYDYNLPVDPDLKEENIESTLFSDMQLPPITKLQVS